MRRNTCKTTLQASIALLALNAAAHADGFGEVEFRFGVADVSVNAGNPVYASSNGADQAAFDLSVGYQMQLDHGLGVQFDLDVTNVDSDKKNNGNESEYGAMTGTLHGFVDVNDGFSFGAFGALISPNTYGAPTSTCDDQHHAAYGLEGQVRLVNGVVIDAIFGKSGLHNAASSCDGQRWDDATFVDLSLTVPVSEEWSLTGGYFLSEALVGFDDPAERTEVRLGAEFAPADTDWSFLTELTHIDYYQTDEGDRSDITTLYIGARLDFGTKADDNRPLLSNAARPLGRAIALSPAID